MFTGQSTELIIRTSDRGAFKRCRQSWNWGSKIRGNLTFKGPAPKPLDFGTSVHRGLEVWYEPSTWKADREMVALMSLTAFRQSQEEQLKKYLKEINEPSLQDDLKADYAERTVLGENMLKGYFQWSAERDANLTPIMVEIEFEVPIFGLEGTYAEGAVYQGRVDLLMQDEKGRYWIWDHKTAAKFDSTEHLELDDQVGSYAWALNQMLGLDIAGVCYNELKKSYPAPPEELKRGGLSKNKQKAPPYEIYVKALEDYYGHIPSDYEDLLDWLKLQPSEYFRRTRVHRTKEEMKNLGEEITLEALDMLDPGLRIYKNATKFNCKNCMFRTPCLAKLDGSDYEFILREQYQTRQQDDDITIVGPQTNQGAGINTSSANEADTEESGRVASSASSGHRFEL